MSRFPISTAPASAVSAQPLAPRPGGRGRSIRPRVTVTPRPENLVRIADLHADFTAFLDRARYVKRYSATTIKWFAWGFVNFRTFLEAAADLEPDRFAIRMNALEEWIAWNTHRGVQQISMNSYWRALRAFFLDRAETTGALNPFAGVRGPRARTTVPKALPPHDCATLLHVARNYPWKTEFQRELAVAVIATMLYAGLRKSELFRLANGHVDLVTGTMLIEKAKGRYGGKDRVALIAPELSRILRSYVAARDRARFASANFFVSACTGRPLSQGTLREIVQRIARAANVRFSPHVLRHSFVTQLIRSGVPLAVVRDLAGHASFQTTLGYTAILDEDREREIRKLHYGA